MIFGELSDGLQYRTSRHFRKRLCVQEVGPMPLIECCVSLQDKFTEVVDAN